MGTERDLTDSELDKVSYALRSKARERERMAFKAVAEAAHYAETLGKESRSYELTQAKAERLLEESRIFGNLAMLFGRYDFTMHSLVHIPEQA